MVEESHLRSMDDRDPSHEDDVAKLQQAIQEEGVREMSLDLMDNGAGGDHLDERGYSAVPPSAEPS